MEGLRGLAALYVVLGHICSMVDPSGLSGRASTSPEWLRALIAPFAHGHLAVAGFIVISGFCLQVSLFNGGAGRITNLRAFLSRRAWRILPPYYACLGLSLIVAVYVTPLGGGMPFDLYLPVTPENVWAHLLLVHNLSPEWMYKINGVLWSISIEAQLYLLFPLLVAILLHGGRTALLIFAGGASFWILASHPLALKLYPWYLGLFALGMASAHLAYRPFVRFGPRPRFAIYVAALGAGCLFRVSWDGMPIPIKDASLGLLLAAVLYAGATVPTLLPVRMLGWKPLAWLGVISYSLYLMHHPIQQALHVYRPAWAQGAEMELVFLSAVGIPAILACCAAFWFLFERPFMYSRTYSETGQRVFVPVSLPLRPIAQPKPAPTPRIAEQEWQAVGPEPQREAVAV